MNCDNFMRPAPPKLCLLPSGVCGIASVLVVAASLLAGCDGSRAGPRASPAPNRNTREVSAAAAADLKYALDDLIEHFQRRHPAIRVTANYGSSGNFFAQLSSKAPYDIFFSADIEYTRKLIKMGLAEPRDEFLYAEGHLVAWVPNASRLDLETLGIRAVTDTSVRKVAIANPRHAPYGRAAEAALKTLGVFESVKDRLVLGENVAQAAQFVESGAADVGIIGLSLAIAPSMRGKGRYWPIPPVAHPPMRQGGVVLSWASDREAARLFRDYVTSAEGRDVFRRFGFSVPEG